MSTWDDMLYKAKAVAETAEKKTTDLIDVAKLKWSVASLQKEQAATYEAMGRLWYDGRYAGRDVTELLEECAARIVEQDKQITDLQDRILQYKDAVRCTACGEANPIDSVYCRKCGQKL